MLKITQAPTKPIQALKQCSVTGTADAVHVGKNLILEIDNQIKITGPTVTTSGDWQIVLAFRQPGNHRLEIALDPEKVELSLQVVATQPKSAENELINQPTNVLVAFYLGFSPDDSGRRLEDIWAWDYQKLGYTHDYIQWLFPLQEKSRFNRTAPVLSDEVIQAFRTNSQLRIRLLSSLKVMLGFYGLRLSEGGSADIQIDKAESYKERKKTWVTKRNHNYLRITRILTSLSSLGLDNYARAFFKCLEQIYSEDSQTIGSETYAYWKNAAPVAD